MDDRDKPNNDVGWVSMLVLASGFAALGVWGVVTGQVAWGVGSILFGLVWAFTALRARRKVKSGEDPRAGR